MVKDLWFFKSRGAQFRIVILCWIAIHLLLFFILGVRPVLESLKYITAADLLVSTGELPEVRYFFYLTTTLLIAFCKKAGIGFVGVVLIQSVLNLLATLKFYSALYKRQINCYSAFLTTLALLCCIPFFTWNFYLYTESIFYSFVLLFFAECFKTHELSWKRTGYQFILLTLIVISRPLGVLFIPCWILNLITKIKGRMRLFLSVGFTLGLILTIGITNLILGNIIDWTPLKPAEYGFIICELPTHSKLNLDHLKNRPPITQLAFYIGAHPFQFISLSLKRALHFFLQVRPYYSTVHNVILCLMNALLYSPIIVNAVSYYRRSTLKIATLLPASIILVFALAVCLQCDDYHNRFHNTIIPVFLYIGLFIYLENNNLKQAQHT